MMQWTTLVQAQALAVHLRQPQLRIFDCRYSLAPAAQGGGPEAGLRMYRQGHVPGALYADLERDLSDMSQTGQGRHPWPDAQAFGQWLGRMGVDADTQVVAYDAGDGAFAARLWCLLRMFGHAHVAVLDGGLAAWTQADLPVEPGDVEPSAGPAYRGSFQHARLLDAQAVQQALHAGEPLIDARAAERFRGEVEPIDAVAGHVPGAINRPYASNLDNDHFKSAPVLRREFETLLGDRKPADAIAMCGSGVTACHHALAMAHAGLPLPRLYTGSWSGWISDPARPVATGPR